MMAAEKQAAEYTGGSKKEKEDDGNDENLKSPKQESVKDVSELTMPSVLEQEKDPFVDDVPIEAQYQARNGG